MSGRGFRELSLNLIGNALTWYSYVLFMRFLYDLAIEFCPKDYAARDTLIFWIFALGLYARPIGGIIFGGISDRLGKDLSICLSIIIMVVATVGIGFIPSVSSVGWLSLALLALCRFLQGIALGGEYTAVIVKSAERAELRYRGFWGSLMECSGSIGMTLASYAEKGYILGLYDMRIPFVCAILLLPFAFIGHGDVSAKSGDQDSEQPDGCLLNLDKLDDEQRAECSMGLLEVLGKYRLEVAVIALVTAFSGISYYTMFSFVPYHLKYTYGDATCSKLYIHMSTMLLLATFVGGILSIRWHRNFSIMMQWGVVFTMCSAGFFFLGGIDSLSGTYLSMLGCSIGIGLYFSTRSAYFVSALPRAVRCRGIGVPMNFAQAIVGGSAMVLAQQISQYSMKAVFIPIAILGACMLLAIRSMVKKKSAMY